VLLWLGRLKNLYTSRQCLTNGHNRKKVAAADRTALQISDRGQIK
jgi:hypothetical protein